MSKKMNLNAAGQADQSKLVVPADEQELIENLEEAEKLKKKVVRSEKGVKHYQWFLARVAVLLLVLWALFFKIIGITHLPNEDMAPRIDAGDLVLFYRLDDRTKSQDVVVIEKQPATESQSQLYVCRVVAAPGDTVEISEGGRLVVNGHTVTEKNIFYDTPAYEGYTQYPLTLAENEYFVLADSRETGADSRYFGAVTAEEIQGTVITIVRRNNI